MSSEQEDDRAEQLEELRRHIVRPDGRWEPPTQLGVLQDRLDAGLLGLGPRRPPRSWLLLGGLLVVVALVAGLLIGAAVSSDDRPGTTGPPASPAAPNQAAAGLATPECKTAVDRANAMLASAVRLRGALAEQDRALNDPANRGLTVAELLDRLAASQRAGASETGRFDRALDAYRQVVDQCRLRAP